MRVAILFSPHFGLVEMGARRPFFLEIQMATNVYDKERTLTRDVVQRVERTLPGIERPLRTQDHFSRVIGRRVVLRTSSDIGGRKRFRGEVKGTSERNVTVGVDGTNMDIPYD